jgi:hypothetical protein
MNTKNHKPVKMRNKISLTEIYYTYPHWPFREIDGVVFLPVVKEMPSQQKTQTIHYIRKDSLEKVL